ncbi:MAG TPA: VanW family protein [Candidatus Woesebacteria bacterium]|nr:VanW family protein [Candidatus Woesebacteria bacterium]HNS64918.1 VanW family protein [Candidatus Woesebacteria bacterium]
MPRKVQLAFWSIYQQISVFGLIVILLIVTLILTLIATKKILPANTYINSVAVGLLSPEAALLKIEAQLPPAPPADLQLSSAKATESAHINELGLYPNILAVIAESQQPQLSKPQRFLFALKSLFVSQKYSIRYLFAEDKILTWVTKFAETISTPEVKPRAVLGRPGQLASLLIEPGEPGLSVDVVATTKQIEDNFNHQKLTTAVIYSPTLQPLTGVEISQSKIRAEKFVGQRLELKNPNLHPSINISDQDLISVLALPDGIKEEELRALVTEIASQVDQEAVNPIFTYDQTSLKVTEFVPPQTGLSLNEATTYQSIVEAFQKIESLSQIDEKAEKDVITIDLVLTEVEPSVSLESTNSLGIKEKIGFGDSYYDHSIPTRIRNVALAASRVNDILIPPGKEFYFNKTLGDVSRATGFEPAYIIRNGLTELGDGGGVCQVSTTLFRSVLDAGLKVTLRLPHSYRVSYYELDRKPGIDATVYSGNVDFRFINDTPNHILIHGETDSKQLYMYYSIYGTSDGRSTEIKDHVTWGYAPPPPTQYIVDPSLPPGAKKQIDWSAAGIKAKFTNVIYDKFDNIIREDTYTSNYKPWSAKYLVGPGTI